MSTQNTKETLIQDCDRTGRGKASSAARTMNASSPPATTENPANSEVADLATGVFEKQRQLLEVFFHIEKQFTELLHQIEAQRAARMADAEIDRQDSQERLVALGIEILSQESLSRGFAPSTTQCTITSPLPQDPLEFFSVLEKLIQATKNDLTHALDALAEYRVREALLRRLKQEEEARLQSLRQEEELRKQKEQERLATLRRQEELRIARAAKAAKHDEACRLLNERLSCLLTEVEQVKTNHLDLSERFGRLYNKIHDISDPEMVFGLCSGLVAAVAVAFSSWPVAGRSLKDAATGTIMDSLRCTLIILVFIIFSIVIGLCVAGAVLVAREWVVRAKYGSDYEAVKQECVTLDKRAEKLNDPLSQIEVELKLCLLNKVAVLGTARADLKTVRDWFSSNVKRLVQ